MRKISDRVISFGVLLAAMTPDLSLAAVDGSITVTSSDPTVLAVQKEDDGSVVVSVMGLGPCQIVASGDADLGDEVRTITNTFDFLVYDEKTEADHFELAITDLVYATTVAAVADENTAGDDAADEKA